MCTEVRYLNNKYCDVNADNLEEYEEMILSEMDSSFSILKETE